MRAMIPLPKSLNPRHPVHERAMHLSVRDNVASDKLGWAQSRVDRIDESLETIQPRQAQAGRISMYEHLNNVREPLVQDPEGQADLEISRRNERVVKLEQRMEPTVKWQ